MADPITQVIQSLGLVTAYGYAKSKGYTGTEEEFEEAAAAIGQGAATATAAAEAASEDAGTATTAAGTATTKAAEAAASALAAKDYKEYAEQAATDATTAKNAAAGSATDAAAAAQTATVCEDNADAAADAASASASDAHDYSEDSKAWAIGVKNGFPVPETADQYNNNAKYYAEQAEAWATGVSGGTASATNNAAYYAAQAADSMARKMDMPRVNDTPSWGTQGQLLMTNGNNGAAWTNAGTPSDAQVGEAVSEWLVAHPEATTTVQDGSLTKAKFADALKLETIKDYVTPKMFGAVGDGLTDDTQAIQAAFNASHYIYFPDGIYLIDGNNDGWGHQLEGGVIPQSDTTIILSKNATLKAKTNSTGFYNILNIKYTENVSVYGGKIQGERNTHEGSSGEFGHGIRISECTNILISNMEIFDCWGDSINLGSADGTTGENNHIIIDNCILHNSRRQGISVVIGKDVIIKNCEIYNISGIDPQSGIDIEPNVSDTVGNIKIIGCYIHDTTGDSILTDTGNPRDIMISDVTADSSNLNIGTNITITSSNIGHVTIGCDSAYFNNSVIKKVSIQCGNAKFTSCKISPDSGNEAILFGLDNYSRTGGSKYVSFSNCNILATNSAYAIFFATAAGKIQDSELDISNCEIHAKALTNRSSAQILRITDTLLDFVNSSYADVYNLIRISCPQTKIIFKGNQIISPDNKPTYLFVSGIALTDFRAIISDNLLYYSTLMTCSNTSAVGKIIMGNNMIKSANNPHSVTGDGASGITVQHLNDMTI